MAATVLVAASAGCAPETSPLLALAQRDGVPVALVQGCGGAPTAVTVTVLGGAGDAPPVQWTATTDVAFRRVEEVPLLRTPPRSWRVTLQDPALRRIEPGTRYVISSSGSNDFWIDGREIYALAAGSVLASDARVAGDVMRRAEFQDRAGAAC